MSIKIKITDPRRFLIPVYKDRTLLTTLVVTMNQDEVSGLGDINKIPYLVRKHVGDFIRFNISQILTNRISNIKQIGNFHPKGNLSIYAWTWLESNEATD